jgi:serine/threonine protein kinase
MSSGRRKDPNDDDKLLTSEDLFGDMLDEKPSGAAPPPAPAAPPPTRRSGPIKVQVSEPSTPDPPAAKSAAKSAPAAPSPLMGPPAEELPDDVAALLDAFSAPGEAASEPPPEPEPLPGGSGGTGESPQLDERGRIHSARAEDEEGLSDLRSLRAQMKPPPPPRGREAAPQDERRRIDSGAAEDERRRIHSGAAEDVPVPKSRMGESRFRAAEAQAPNPGARTLDLAAIADEALGHGPPAPATPKAAPAEAAEPRGREAAPPAAPVSATEPVPDEGEYGPYRLLARVAVGGMAEVFKAKRSGVEGFEKVVAVKRILPHLSDNKEFVDMFVDEAKMVAGLTHPNIVQIFDLGRIEKSYYIAMEYVQGRDLRSILRRARERGTRVPLDLCALIASRVCAALEYAHRKKDDRGQPMMTVHRDISPQNILISFEGDVKLTDFGIAKAASKATVTEAGALRGKLLYMSPEQAWGKAMDRRSDLFSLGIVFYEMLTDHKPFLGSSEVSILETVRECKVPAPRTLNPAIPESLERVVMKALERDPDRRYQDAAEMYRDLEAVLHETQPPPTSAALARLMEQLYEPREREGTVVDEAHEPVTASDSGAEAPPPAEPPPPPPAESTGPSASMSIQKLLKRFGIK